MILRLSFGVHSVRCTSSWDVHVEKGSDHYGFGFNLELWFSTNNRPCLVKMGKWSEGDQWKVDGDGAREESDDVITRSRIWFLSWVGKSTCWVRLKEDNTGRNWEVIVSVGLSRCMLKSPLMINTWGVVAGSERKELNSSENLERVHDD